MIVATHTTGKRFTHNRDAYYTLAWRLLDDGTLERTNTRSKYQPHIEGEKIPDEIKQAAASRGITIKPGRILTR